MLCVTADIQSLLSLCLVWRSEERLAVVLEPRSGDQTASPGTLRPRVFEAVSVVSRRVTCSAVVSRPIYLLSLSLSPLSCSLPLSLSVSICLFCLPHSLSPSPSHPLFLFPFFLCHCLLYLLKPLSRNRQRELWKVLEAMLGLIVTERHKTSSFVLLVSGIFL